MQKLANAARAAAVIGHGRSSVHEVVEWSMGLVELIDGVKVTGRCISWRGMVGKVDNNQPVAPGLLPFWEKVKESDFTTWNENNNLE